MKKHRSVCTILISAFLCSLAALFSSCGSAKELTVCVSLADKQYYSALAEQYESQTPGVTVQVVAIPTEGGGSEDEQNAAVQKMQTEIMSGKGPDLFVLPAFSSIELFPDLYKTAAGGAFCELSDLLSDVLSAPEYNGEIFRGGVIEEKQYLLPLTYGFLATAALPGTFETVKVSQNDTPVQFMEKILTAFPTERYDSLGLLGMVWGGYPSFLDTAARPLVDHEAQKVWFDEDTAEHLDMCKKLFDLGVLDSASLQAVPSGSPYEIIPCEDFPVFGSHAGSRQSVERICLMAELSGVSLEIAPVPNGEGGTTAFVASYAAIRSNSRAKDLAAAFIRDCLLSDAVQGGEAVKNVYPSDRYLPVRRSALAPMLVNQNLDVFPGGTQTPPCPNDTLSQMQNAVDTIDRCRFTQIDDRLLQQEIYYYFGGRFSYDELIGRIEKEYKYYFDE